MYVNYYDCYERLENENPTIGIVSLADTSRLGYSCGIKEA